MGVRQKIGNAVGSAVSYEKHREWGYNAVDDNSSLEEIDKEARTLIWWARRKGWNVAADNLEYFLDGKGGTESKVKVKRISRNWLRGFRRYKDVENSIRTSFQNDILNEIRSSAVPGRDSTIPYNWIFMFPITYYNKAESNEELFYASGDSKLTGKGAFDIVIRKNIATVKGAIEFTWSDTYNFHKGKAVIIPLKGKIPDAAMVKLTKQGKARNYKMECKYNQLLYASFDITRWRSGVNWDWGLCF